MSTGDAIVSQYAELRREMVEQIARHAQLAARETGKAMLSDTVMEVMKAVPRHEFVPVELRAFAYSDSPLPIGYDKTISQPFIVALMTDLLDLQPTDRVLDVGTGLGYQAAILAKLVDRVYTVEILEELAPLTGHMLQTAVESMDNGTAAAQIDADYSVIRKFLGHDPVTVDEIAKNSGLTIDQVSSMLLILELEGVVESQSGGRYSLLAR